MGTFKIPGFLKGERKGGEKENKGGVSHSKGRKEHAKGKGKKIT